MLLCTWDLYEFWTQQFRALFSLRAFKLVIKCNGVAAPAERTGVLPYPGGEVGVEPKVT